MEIESFRKVFLKKRMKIDKRILFLSACIFYSKSHSNQASKLLLAERRQRKKPSAIYKNNEEKAVHVRR